MSVELVHLPGARLARQTLLEGRPWAKVGAEGGRTGPARSRSGREPRWCWGPSRRWCRRLPRSRSRGSRPPAPGSASDLSAARPRRMLRAKTSTYRAPLVESTAYAGQISPPGGRSECRASAAGARAGEIDGDGVAERADAFERQRFAGGRGQVPGTAFDVGTAVDHLGDQGVAVVDELDGGSAGQVAMGDADRLRAENLSARRFVAVKAGPVPTGAGAAKGAEGDFLPFRRAAAVGDGGGAAGVRLGGDSAAGQDRQRGERGGPAQVAERAPQGSGHAPRVFFPRRAVSTWLHVSFQALAGLADGLALKELRSAADAGDSPQLIASPALRGM